MTAIETMLRDPVIQAIGWALVHFLWQGALIALIASAAKWRQDDRLPASQGPIGAKCAKRRIEGRRLDPERHAVDHGRMGPTQGERLAAAAQGEGHEGDVHRLPAVPA